ncbi:hypothetical protein [Parapedobacter sp. GCM10030251]|uniref:hypothetical protein n=1 Tax=Parapedobacter sp. GCM10030251 TaxID=3273419 RepID=UPI003671EC6B
MKEYKEYQSALVCQRLERGLTRKEFCTQYSITLGKRGFSITAQSGTAAPRCPHLAAPGIISRRRGMRKHRDHKL